MKKQILFSILGTIFIIVVGFLIFFKLPDKPKEKIIENETVPVVKENFPNKNLADANSPLHEPIANALKRVTKKPFGIKISINDSPVQPEKFSGYHTGVDFEIFTEEENLEIDISAICVGSLVAKKQATGYGGVAIQQCEIDNEPVTIIYGHLKLSSIVKNLNEDLALGEKIGILGQGFSEETDGERRHLHLGIHRGNNINLLGYVQDQQDLKDWIDYQKLINK